MLAKTVYFGLLILRISCAWSKC